MTDFSKYWIPRTIDDAGIYNHWSYRGEMVHCNGRSSDGACLYLPLMEHGFRGICKYLHHGLCTLKSEYIKMIDQSLTPNIWHSIAEIKEPISGEILVIVKSYKPGDDKFIYASQMLSQLHHARREMSGGRIVAYMVLSCEQITQALAKKQAALGSETGLEWYASMQIDD